MQRLDHCVLLLMIVVLPNKSEENASESLNHPNNNKRYDNTTHVTNSSRNKSVQTLKETSRENFSGNSLGGETSFTSTGREELHEEEDDEFARHEVTKYRKRQARTVMDIFLTPIRYENGVFFTTKPRDNTTTEKMNFIRLCCPLDHRLSLKKRKCFVDRNITFPFVQKMDKTLYGISNVLYFLFGPACPYRFSISSSYSTTMYTFDDNATMHFPDNRFLSSEKYCLAAVNREGFDVITCQIKHFTSTTYLFVATIVSLIFLLITFVVYSVLQEFRNMHGYTMRAYIASLFVPNAMFAVYLQVDGSSESICSILAFIFNFAMYSTFLWLNVTCFDTWWAFRRVLPIHTTRKSRKELNTRMKKTFMIYALYAWGVSFVVTLLTIIMDIVPNIPDYLIKPQICETGFWFGSKKAKTLYFYVPVGVSLICNICLFLMTALKILCDKKRIHRQMKSSESCRHDSNKDSLWIYLKLFIMMGINWIPINITVKMGNSIMDEQTYYQWLVSNVITPLQSIIIFIIFVCKKNVIRLLMQRCVWSDESLLGHFRMRRAVHHEEIALDYRGQHNEIRNVREIQETNSSV